uniref:Putative secreted protein n=1 Tax=Amblyomma americanum TaxID=6943 RepID=A0A0C9RX46_AMBAM
MSAFVAVFLHAHLPEESLAFTVHSQCMCIHKKKKLRCMLAFRLSESCFVLSLGYATRSSLWFGALTQTDHCSTLHVYSATSFWCWQCEVRLTAPFSLTGFIFFPSFLRWKCRKRAALPRITRMQRLVACAADIIEQCRNSRSLFVAS